MLGLLGSSGLCSDGKYVFQESPCDAFYHVRLHVLLCERPPSWSRPGSPPRLPNMISHEPGTLYLLE